MPAEAITTGAAAADTTARGYTPRELARLLRISPDRVRAMIQSGELGAVDTARVRCGRPRYVILPQHLQEWARRRRVSPPPKLARRRKRTDMVDYFPD
jgi:excisionase family DNA binding protein